MKFFQKEYNEYKNALSKLINTTNKNPIGKLYYIEDNTYYIYTLRCINEEGVCLAGRQIFKNIINKISNFPVNTEMYLAEFFETEFLTKEEFVNQMPSEIKRLLGDELYKLI